MFEPYLAEGCPSCKFVREKMTEIGQSPVLHTPCTASGAVRNEQTYAELTVVGGADQIPFLVAM